MLKRWAFIVLGLSLLASALQAKVYYVNRGVKYHLGDDRANRSADSEFLDAFPSVGQEWIQAFTVDREDDVRISIENIWGVDDCRYCKDFVAIDEHDMGRLSEENNHQSFDTPAPLAMHVKPGHVYRLKVSSRGGSQVDDFAIEGVSIETDAEVTLLAPGPVLLNPGDTMPSFSVPRPVLGPCDGTTAIEHWMPDKEKSRGQIDFGPLALPVSRRVAVPLAVGQFIDLYAKVDGSGQGEAVDQFVEILVGTASSGWVLSFEPGAVVPTTGNLKRKGRYSADTFKLDAWKKGQWNQLRLARCEAGSVRLWLNGQALGGALPVTDDAGWPVTLRSGGLTLRVAEKPI